MEDYGNEIFTEYANSFYNFEQVRKEMDFIRGKGEKHGNIKIRNFLNALLISCQE
ncbi:MAG: DNA-binding domain-containing protein [Lachnoclostridium sp.]